MLWTILGILISYLVGSIPTAYVFGRILKGIDIRNFGSGNVGATNAWRVLGRPAGISVLILDILKGFLVVIFVGDFVLLKTTVFSADNLRIILGLSCISGHNWTVFLKFKGGKGIATTFGVLLGLALKIVVFRSILLLVSLTWAIAFLITRIVSLASVLTGIILPIYMAVLKQSATLILSSFLLAFFILLRHRSNLKRILQGKERRLF